MDSVRTIIATDNTLRQLLVDQRQMHIMAVRSLERALGLPSVIITKEERAEYEAFKAAKRRGNLPATLPTG